MLLEKEVVGLDDLHTVLGKRPYESRELRNIDRFRGELQRGVGALKPAAEGVWDWINSFRSPGLQLAGFGDLGGSDGDEGGSDEEEEGGDDDDEGGSGGGGGGPGGFWQSWGSGKRFPVAT